MLNRAVTLFSESRFYLGASIKAFEECITLLKSVIEKFAHTPSEKCLKLIKLITTDQYNYIICVTQDEAESLSSHLKTHTLPNKPTVISLADVNDGILGTVPTKAILTGWAKTNNMTRLLSSFLFSELAVLFYPFEAKYLNSLQNRNKRFSTNVKSTIDRKGIRSEIEIHTINGFSDLYRPNHKKNQAQIQTLISLNLSLHLKMPNSRNTS